MRPTLRQYQSFIILTLLLQTIPLLGQNELVDNRRTYVIHNKADSFTISTALVLSHTLHITPLGHSIAVDSTNFSLERHRFIWNPHAPIRQMGDSLSFQLSFRVLPFNFTTWQSRFDSILYQDGSMRVLEPITMDAQRGAEPFISEQGIQYDGTFSRGLSLGNRQDLVLNSNFDLRMAGQLGDGIEVLAALSDNSIPLQPEGNTQQLQEFDKIFIQLSKGGNTLTGGDFNLNRPEGHFMNYFKRNQGVKIESISPLKRGRQLVTSASIGGTRGKFARITVPTREGNQGPYRLQGVEGERFIIILAGSERIYLDGVLLVRGQQQDYIIDYNAGELTFTANRIITKDSRIIAEYEYSDQNYNRSIITFGSQYHTDRWKMVFNAYSEQDGKLSSGLNTLTAEDKRALAALGDSIKSASSSSIRIREEGYDPNIVMYKMIDTIGFTNVLVRSTNPDSALYTAKFTQVGAGQGNYLRINEEANGVVFGWIAPDSLTGQPRGQYEPIARLVSPQQQQMFSLANDFKLGPRGSLRSEVSLSRMDLNRFSDKNADDDYGYAIMTAYQNQHSLSKDSSDHGLQLITGASHEYLSQHFQILKPYRNQEFARDWNVMQLDRGEEHLTSAHLRLVKANILEIGHEYSGFFRSKIYRGNKHVTKVGWKRGGFSFQGTWNTLDATDDQVRSQFKRPRLDIAQRFSKDQTWTLGFYFEEERNEERTLFEDTIRNTSFYYDLGRLYLRKAANDQLNLELSYQKRIDYTPTGRKFSELSLADDVALKAKWTGGKKSILDATFTFRNLDIKVPNLIPSDGGLNYVGRINHQLNLGNGALRTTTLYEVSSGQEPRRTFQYLKVDPGQGVYTWIDLNDDGIQQINEFEIAPFQEQAEYVRITVLTNEFIATNNVLLNQSYSLDPRRIMKNKKAWLSKFSDQGSIRIDRKNLESSEVSLWNPFSFNIADSSLVSISSQIRNVLYFNRSNPKYDIQYEWNDLRNRFVLTTGYESKELSRNILRSRMNFSQVVSGLFSVTRESNHQDSETFDNKDYDIKSWEIKPELTYQPSSKFRILTNYRFVNRVNDLTEKKEMARIHDLKIETTMNRVSTSSLRANLSLVLIDFNGPKNGALEFAMLEGLKTGTNWLWGISYDRKLVNNIRVNLSYNGRKSGEARVVHTARAQVSAFF